MQGLSRRDLFRQQAYVAGQWLDADNGETLEVNNPANGELLGVVPKMGRRETRRAIEAAERAQKLWRAKSAKERAIILRKWFDLVMLHQDDLARIMTLEQGKPLAEAKGEIAYGAAYLEWYAEEGKRAYGDVIPGPASDRRIVVTKEPVGVCAAITPWNFPSAMITRKVGAALGAGCSIVVKPAAQTPYSAYALCVLAEEAGVPAGLISVITGSASEIGKEMTSNPIVRKFSFTGSTEVGRLLMSQCSDQIKKVSLELGGNAPFIVFNDADIDAAVEGAIISKYRNAGQTCVCANRIYVQDEIYDAFAEKFVAAVEGIQVGDGTISGVTQGPLIDEAAVKKVKEHIDDVVAKGGKIATGGKPHRLGGLFFEPTVVTEVTSAMKVAKEETFGPLAPLFRFKDEEDVVRMANDTEYGLAAYFYSRDLSRVWRVAEALEYGMVAVNTGILSNEAAPFGGVKQSGIGREGAKYGLDDYMETKYMLMGGI
ncbi:Succinate-semialdehyde dehydrogenase [NADP(+)] GabD [Oligella ureolytica]|uniref:NADP-dependent succinate-semialdehyde dehydrogenase n=1 Tax=Oligella ureolytica TaxID=90244 RepID=A0A378XK94_9BURK|nr:NADP-dependent succinate-semialdehyde dehydrogenase [Oligella ureolytica]QPT40017.1 NADP-dependent succinate-semialdehyde dehydrogenase [Oligella ureolytica]SUA51746.1 Succinate-semialdehyde dehydrogenase [NADP(+)] GabD [Oligella ureolytica]SUA58325.1 Succinate-semialdehyde dehydrogenase [NADP(+)] GabD [Oligella ureolytica]